MEHKVALFAQLRGNIPIARLKVTLDKELNRPTTPKQKALAGMKLPPLRSRTVESPLDDQLGRRETADTVKALAGMTMPRHP